MQTQEGWIRAAGARRAARGAAPCAGPPAGCRCWSTARVWSAGCAPSAAAPGALTPPRPAPPAYVRVGLDGRACQGPGRANIQAAAPHALLAAGLRHALTALRPWVALARPACSCGRPPPGTALAIRGMHCAHLRAQAAVMHAAVTRLTRHRLASRGSWPCPQAKRGPRDATCALPLLGGAAQCGGAGAHLARAVGLRRWPRRRRPRNLHRRHHNALRGQLRALLQRHLIRGARALRPRRGVLRALAGPAQPCAGRSCARLASSEARYRQL